VSSQGVAPALLRDRLEALGRLDTCTLANAIEATGVRLRNEGYMDASVRCLFPDLRPLLGYALTLRVHTSSPPVRGVRYVDHIDWAQRLLALPPPRLLVVEDVKGGPGSGSFMGEVHANIYAALGCAGVITNGAVRDLPALGRLSFPTFASYVSVSHAYAHLVEVGSAVTVGGLTVHTGDLLHGDRHGVLSIPLEVAAELPAIAARQKAEEQKIIQFCRSTQFSVEGLARLLQQVQSENPLPE
jgi:4-hydroxy-4-methyl-2-oxoglutarate aldolase